MPRRQAAEAAAAAAAAARSAATARTTPLKVVFLLGLFALVSISAAADYYDYAYDSYYDEKKPSAKDDHGYYGSDDASYYEEYGYYADDAFGYDEYYDDFDAGGSGKKGGKGNGGKGGAGGKGKNGSSKAGGGKDGGGGGGVKPAGPQDCVVVDGKPKLSNGTAPCDVKFSGVDKHADLLKGGLDGVYKLKGCHNGRPLYVRDKSPPGEARVLWYSTGFGDWDVSNGTEPNEAEILLYGGDTRHAAAPLFVEGWHLGADLKSDSDMGDDDYFPVPDATVKCADGKTYEAPPVAPAAARPAPVLTDDEIEAKYRFVYEKYGRRPEPNPTVNFSFIVLLVVVGLGAVLSIPYLLVYRKDPKGGSYQPVATTSFAQVIQQSKKKQSGHIN